MTSIYCKVKQGLALDDTLIIDCHCHMGPWSNFNAPDSSADGMIKSMDILGIDKACVTAHCSIGPNYVYGNNIVAQAIKKYPERFLGYITVNANYEDSMRDEICRCFSIEGFIGIKLHPDLHGCSIDDRRYHHAYEIADERKCPVLIHTWGTQQVLTVDRLAGQYPNAKFILGHSGAETGAMMLMAESMTKHNNVYGDFALSRTYEGNIEWMVREMGSKKLLYGSDMPFFDPRPAVGRIALAQISDGDKRNLLGLNMKELLETD